MCEELFSDYIIKDKNRKMYTQLYNGNLNSDIS